MRRIRRCDALSCTDTSDTPGLPAYRAILCHNWPNQANKPVHLQNTGYCQSGSPGQSGSRVTDVPGRVGSRVSVTDPVPSLIRTEGTIKKPCKKYTVAYITKIQ